jgi:hypothetical protein
MAKITFSLLGNADSYLIQTDLNNFFRLITLYMRMKKIKFGEQATIYACR